MASLKDIKRQIKSVKNTQKTTKAMKLVSTSKLKKAEQVAKRSREYADKITETLREIAYKVQKYYIYGTDSRYIANKDEVREILDLGAKKARDIATPMMEKIRTLSGIKY
jgi:F-type H+-transporting ATPase subunit gamma